MTLWLWHRFLEDLEKLLTTKGELSVVDDKAVEAVEGQVVYQVVFGLTTFLLRLDATVVHLSLSPTREIHGSPIVVTPHPAVYSNW